MDDAPKWDVKECDCEEVGGSCRLGHDEILRLRAALDKAEGERDDVTQGLLDMLRRAQLAEEENAKLREALESVEAWDRMGAHPDELPRRTIRAALSPTQPAPAGECCNPYCDEAALCCKAAKETP